MAYVLNTAQKRRGEDEAATSGGSEYGASGSQPVDAAPKQNSTAKTPMRAQVEANKGYSQDAAINRVYKPFEQEVAARKSGYDDQTSGYLANEAENTKKFRIEQPEIDRQVASGQLKGPLSQVLGGYNESMNPGQFNVNMAPIDAAKELAGRNASQSLLRGSSGQYGRGMAGLDNALLRKSGGIGQLSQAIGQGTTDLRNYGLGLQDPATLKATQDRAGQVAATQGLLKGSIGTALTAQDKIADDRNAARLTREQGERTAAGDPGREAIQKALAGFSGDTRNWGNQAEFDQIKDLDINKYMNQGVNETSRYSQMNPDELGYINALRGMQGQNGVEAGDAGDQDYGLDMGRLQGDIDSLSGQWEGRKTAEINSRAAETETARLKDIEDNRAKAGRPEDLQNTLGGTPDSPVSPWASPLSEQQKDIAAYVPNAAPEMLPGTIDGRGLQGPQGSQSKAAIVNAFPQQEAARQPSIQETLAKMQQDQEERDAYWTKTHGQSAYYS